MENGEEKKKTKKKLYIADDTTYKCISAFLFVGTNS